MDRQDDIWRSLSPGILRTQAFRIVLIYLFLFAVSATALVGFTYWNTGRALDAQTDQSITGEIASLAEQYQHHGFRALSDAIAARSVHNSQGLYLLVDSDNRRAAGNLFGWPHGTTREDGFIEFAYQRDTQDGLVSRRARGLFYPLAGGHYRLLVARDVQERHLTKTLFTTTLPWSVGLMLLFGLIGGAYLSRNLLRRLDAINRTSAEIVAGDLTRRVPISKAGDEFDALAENLNRMLDRIERLMKGMREVVDSVAHDLRTPLNRLRNRLEEMQTRAETNTVFAADIDGAVAETDRLIATFNALLLIAEADAGVARGTMTPLDLTALVTDIADLYAPLAEEKTIGLAVAPSGVATIEGNQTLVGQALANMIDNAIKYTPAGGHIDVSVGEIPTGIVLTVADTGPGIPEEDRTRVLQRFVRLEKSRNSPGTGLGLSLVDAVARMHGAKLFLDDNAPGLKASIVFPRPAVRKKKPIEPAKPVET